MFLIRWTPLMGNYISIYRSHMNAAFALAQLGLCKVTWVWVSICLWLLCPLKRSVFPNCLLLGEGKAVAFPQQPVLSQLWLERLGRREGTWGEERKVWVLPREEGAQRNECSERFEGGCGWADRDLGLRLCVRKRVKVWVSYTSTWRTLVSS